MSESIELNPYYTWNLNIGFSFYFIDAEDYEEAIIWARRINRPSLLWDPLLRTAILGLLNNKEEAIKASQELLLISPQFPQRARLIVNRFLFDKDLQDALLKGLVLAGITIDD